MKKIQYSENDQIDRSYYKISNRTMQEIIDSGGLSIGKKALFINEYGDKSEGCLYILDGLVVIKLG